MSKFHSTVSRRDFMKVLGLAGAGLGAAAATAPVFHDLDEALSSPLGNWDRGWWVKEREANNPTVEIDWNLIKPADQVERMYRLDPSDPTGVKTKYAYRSTIYKGDGAQVKSDMILAAGRKWNPDWQGDSLRDMALSGAVGYGRVRGEPFVGPASKTKSPEDRGLAKWTGTPEENLRLIRTAFRFFGVTDVGAVNVDEKNVKLVFTRNRWGGSGWRYNKFEDIPKAYEEETATGGIGHIPNSCKDMIVWTVLQPLEGTKRYGTLSSAAASRAYQQISVIEGQMQNFLHGIGYQGIQGGTGSIAPSNAWGVLAGIGEMSRAYHVITSPEYGNAIRGMNRMLTDLPLAPTNPIDSGIQRFCYDCVKCADACPSDSMMRDREPTWEHPSAPLAMNPALSANSDMQSDYQSWPWNITGIKAWWLDVPTCVMCRNCMGSCTFTKVSDAIVHQVVQVGIATTSIFNSFFRTMDDSFGYGLKDPDSFWELNLPAYGIDTTRGARKY